MARALSQVYTIIRGSVGGLTYLANQFHQIVVRARTAPVNPSTQLQTVIRSSFAAASQAWKNMTQKQRDDWDTYARSAIFTGPLGDYTIPGRSIFMAGFTSASYLENSSLVTNTPVLLPPVQTGFAIIDNITVSDPAGPTETGFRLSIGNPGPQNVGIIANISLGFDPSRKFYKGPWDTNDTQGLDLTASTTGLIEFLELTAGLRYFFRLKGVEIEAPHRITSEFFGSAIAVAIGP